VGNLKFLILLILFSSCGAYKRVVYVQSVGKPVDLSASKQITTPEIVFKNGDMLMITVSTVSPEASASFNPPLIADANQSVTEPNKMSFTSSLITYIVDINGEISFPVLGKIKVAGLKKSELEKFIKSSIYPRYIKEDPMIIVRLLNYRISVLGDVGRPGMYSFSNERITIFEALTNAGDLSVYGKRKDILLVREDGEGRRLTYRIDLTDPALIESSYYFLQQNDVIYVEPNGPKRRSSYFGVGESMTLGIIGTLLSVTSFMIAILR